MKRSVHVPRYNWGLITHDSVGSVAQLSANSKEVTVTFPEQGSWQGMISEMDIVSRPHRGVKCNSCQVLVRLIVTLNGGDE